MNFIILFEADTHLSSILHPIWLNIHKAILTLNDHHDKWTAWKRNQHGVRDPVETHRCPSCLSGRYLSEDGKREGADA